MTGVHLPIDENGWRIPKEGTRSAIIYEAYRNGISPTKIAENLGISVGAVRVLAWKIRHPAAANARAHRRQEIPVITEESP